MVDSFKIFNKQVATEESHEEGTTLPDTLGGLFHAPIYISYFHHFLRVSPSPLKSDAQIGAGSHSLLVIMRAAGGDHGSFLPLTPRRSMEEVWGSITMSGSGRSPLFAAPPPLFFPHHHHPVHPSSTTEHSSAAFRGIILQDFLAGASTDQSPNPPPPAAALNLNTTPIPHHSDSSSDTSHSHLWAAGDGDRLFFSPENANRRATEKQLGDGEGGRSGPDRRQKRMMKNRESAARSRARKQAYTNDLEIEVARLAKENAMLRKQYEELRMAVDAHALTTKRMLQRSSSTSF